MIRYQRSGPGANEARFDLKYTSELTPGVHTNFPFKAVKFSAGELGITVDVENLPTPPLAVSITYGSAEVSEAARLLLWALADHYLAIDRLDIKVTLIIGYHPHGRQDRVTSPGTPAALHCWIESMVASRILGEVVIVDPHSQATRSHWDRFARLGLTSTVTILDQKEFIPEVMDRFFSQGDFDAFTGNGESPLVIVAPDAGARNRASMWASFLETHLALEYDVRVLNASKVRDPATGQILKLTLEGDIPENATIIVPDDICDGGRTFIGVAEAISEKRPKEQRRSLNLFVTHGLFPKGINHLLEHFDSVVTTDTVTRECVSEKATLEVWDGMVVPVLSRLTYSTND